MGSLFLFGVRGPKAPLDVAQVMEGYPTPLESTGTSWVGTRTGGDGRTTTGTSDRAIAEVL